MLTSIITFLIVTNIVKSAPVLADRKSNNDVKIIRYCGRNLADCILNFECAKTLLCFKNCPTDDVVCTNQCFFENSSPAFNALAECMIKNNCMPDISFSQTKCPFDGKIDGKKGLIENIFLKDNIGKYYVARGWNRGYDCADCQKIQYSGVFGSDQQIRLETHWSSEINGKIKTANNSLIQDSPGTMMTQYKLFGMDVEEHYYLLDWTMDGSWVMFYYCGYTFNREYQGALLLTRGNDFDTLPEGVEARFDQAILNADLSEYLGPLSEWCLPKFNDKCKQF